MKCKGFSAKLTFSGKIAKSAGQEKNRNGPKQVGPIGGKNRGGVLRGLLTLGLAQSVGGGRPAGAMLGRMRQAAGLGRLELALKAEEEAGAAHLRQQRRGAGPGIRTRPVQAWWIWRLTRSSQRGRAFAGAGRRSEREKAATGSGRRGNRQGRCRAGTARDPAVETSWRQGAAALAGSSEDTSPVRRKIQAAARELLGLSMVAYDSG